MTPDDFTQLVETMGPEVRSRAVLDTVRFRIGAKTFATLGWPAEGWAVVKLSAADQDRALAASEAFGRAPGRPRRSGVTLVRLKGVDAAVLAEVLAAAWRLADPASARAGGRQALAGARLDLG